MTLPAETEREKARRLVRKARATITPEEDAAITAAAETDPDNPPADDALIAAMREAAARHPIMGNRDGQRRSRGPQKSPTKKRIALRLSPHVLEHFRATGPGWQSRINAALEQIIARGQE